MNSAKHTNIFVFVLFVYQIFASFALGALIAMTGMSSLGLITVINQILVFIVPCAVVLLLNRNRAIEIFSLRNPGALNIVFAIGIGIFIQPIMMSLSAFSALFFENRIGDIVSEIATDGNLGVTLLVVAMTPAICEELMLRGVILDGYRHSTMFVSAIINGLFFGMIHMDMQQFLYAAVLGFVFSYMVRYSKSIFLSMVAHFTINGIQTSMLFYSITMGALETEMIEDKSVTLMAAGGLFAFALITSPIIIGIFYLFKKHNERRQTVSVNMDTVLYNNDEPISPENGREITGEGEKVFNWAFWATIAFYALLMVMIKVVIPWITEWLLKNGGF